MSKTYRITVDGTAYTVEVEDLSGSAASSAPLSAPAPAAAPAPAPAAAPAPAPAAAPAPAPAPAPAAAPAPSGGTPVTAPMPGKVLRVVVAAGEAVKEGDLVLILEAMKMENEIFSPAAGVVRDVRVRDGETVNTGDAMMIIG